MINIGNTNWADISTEQSQVYTKKLPPGFYIAFITSVVNVPERQYIRVHYDIAEDPGHNGEYRQMYAMETLHSGTDKPCFFKSYKPSALRMFKAFLEHLQASNTSFVANQFSGDENELKGLLVGVEIGNRTYKDSIGIEHTVFGVINTISAADARRKALINNTSANIEPQKPQGSSFEAFGSVQSRF